MIRREMIWLLLLPSEKHDLALNIKRNWPILKLPRKGTGIINQEGLKLVSDGIKAVHPKCSSLYAETADAFTAYTD
jgi:hypothetical protein